MEMMGGVVGKRVLSATKPYYALSGSTNIEPDVWLEPCQVWEVRCADFTLSPAHTAARVRLFILNLALNTLIH